MSNILRQQLLFTAEHEKRGWFTGVFADEPFEVSTPHAHGEAHLLILDGSVELTLDGGEVLPLHAGHEVDIKEGQLHAAVAGPDGFQYAFACPPEEAARQDLV